MPEDSSCETGWLQFRQDKCYRFVHIRLAFDDAESLCNNLYAGHLPSIHSQEEQFMITQFLASVNVKNGSEIWLGGRQMDFHNFNWGDGSLFNYSYWEHGEPNFPAEKCIEMSWRNGRWNDINCRLKRAVLCERQVSSRHLIKPNLYQPTTCLESNCSTVIGATGQASVAVSALELARLPPESHSDVGNSSSPGGPAEQANITTASGLTLLDRSSVTLQEPADGLAGLPIDDRPIKVISSIMHREQPTTVEPSLHSTDTSPAATTISSLSIPANTTAGNSTSLSAPPNPPNATQFNLPRPDQSGPEASELNPKVREQPSTFELSFVNTTASDTIKS